MKNRQLAIRQVEVFLAILVVLWALNSGFAQKWQFLKFIVDDNMGKP